MEKQHKIAFGILAGLTVGLMVVIVMQNNQLSIARTLYVDLLEPARQVMTNNADLRAKVGQLQWELQQSKTQETHAETRARDSAVQQSDDDLSAQADSPFAFTVHRTDQDDDGVFLMIGSVTNNSGENFDIAAFEVSLYDRWDGLLNIETFGITGLPAGATRNFRFRCYDTGDFLVEKWSFRHIRYRF